MKSVAETMAPWVFLEEPIVDHDFHWHRYGPDHPDFMSIFVDHKSWDEWIVEIYPIEEGSNDVRRFGFEDREDAVEKVVELMEKYD
jgi:hypothetical protein